MKGSRSRAPALRCASCDAPIDAEPAFCQTCGRPTAFATYEEKTAWEVAQWRRHYGAPAEAVAAPAPIASAVAVAEIEPAWQRRANEREERALAREAVARIVPERETASNVPLVPEMAPRPSAVVRSSDPVPIFASSRIDRPATYRLCMNCGAADWVMRAGRTESGTWRYWCVRCARSFATDLRLAPALKPLMISSAVLVAIVLGAARLASLL